ncbi:MAG: class I SAM-dependent methyltransferase [Candidatus Hydrogenedentes bacterium]|nr:class I SAM-dependent methyltransferase [Candidatus Hydrogenedentota bacterium]
MNISAFETAFADRFPLTTRNLPSYEFWDPIVSQRIDPCPEVKGMLSIKKQQLLHLAFGLLAEGEAYLEVGTYQGKSLLSAMLNNPPRPVFACDNFSQFDDNTAGQLRKNLALYGLLESVVFRDCDVADMFTAERLPLPIGLYFYDGAHDYDSQYQAIARIEPFLAPEALVLVDDWRFAEDSQSHAKAASEQAARDSGGHWRVLYELPARFNGDRAMWWNGVGVLSYKR